MSYIVDILMKYEFQSTASTNIHRNFNFRGFLSVGVLVQYTSGIWVLISGTETRHFPLNLLQPGQARFLCAKIQIICRMFKLSGNILDGKLFKSSDY